MVRVHRQAGTVVGERVGVQTFVAEEPKCPTVKVIRAGFRDDIDGSAAGATDLRRVVVSVHLEFLHGVLAEGVGAEAGASGGLAEEEIIGIAAVHQQGVRGAALAGKREVAATSGVLDHAWRQRRKVDEVAPVDRKVGHCALTYRSAGGGASGFDDWGFGRNRNSLRRRSDLHPCVNGGHRADVESNALPDLRLEALEFERQIVDANRHAGKAVQSSIRRSDRSRVTSLRTLSGDTGARDGGSAGVDDSAVDGSTADFRLGKAGQRQYGCQNR